MAKGYIKLHRDLMDHWIWSGDDVEPFTKGQAWVDLLMLANHRPSKAIYAGKLQVFETGTVNRSLAHLATRWRWGRDKVRRFLLLLEEDGMIRRTSNNQGTVIEIINYARWQSTADATAGSIEKSTKTQSGRRASTTADATADATANRHIQECKELKKDIPPLTPPAGGRRKRMPRSEDEVQYDHTDLIKETMV